MLLVHQLHKTKLYIQPVASFQWAYDQQHSCIELSIYFRLVHLVAQRQLNLSEPQIQDILYIRRLYHTRRGMLQAQRQAHMSKICANKSVHPHQDFGQLADLADGLKAAALHDCKLYHNVGHALAWGVSVLSILSSNVPVYVTSLLNIV